MQPNYQAAAAAGALSSLVQAIERANSTASEDVKEALQQGGFDTIYGRVDFDAPGQIIRPLPVLQYLPPTRSVPEAASSFLQADGSDSISTGSNAQVAVVFPLDVKSASVTYPLPTWLQRDCWQGPCEKPNEINITSSTVQGTCDRSGQCACPSELGDTVVSVDDGINAMCSRLVEDAGEEGFEEDVVYGIVGGVVFVLLVGILLYWKQWKRVKVLRKLQRIEREKELELSMDAKLTKDYRAKMQRQQAMLSYEIVDLASDLVKPLYVRALQP